jgi:hypothetical protein
MLGEGNNMTRRNADENAISRRDRANGEKSMGTGTIVLMVAGAFALYALVKNTPDLIRYIKITRM